MKTPLKYMLITILGILSISACTVGDKGGEKVPDSVKIDTSIKTSEPAAETSDTTLIDSLQTDTARMEKPQ